MDKRDLLGRLAANGDERLLLGRVWDKYEQCRRRNIPVVTGFLSPAEQELVRRLMGALDVREGWLLWGGYDTAQRRQAHFLPIGRRNRTSRPWPLCGPPSMNPTA